MANKFPNGNEVQLGTKHKMKNKLANKKKPDRLDKNSCSLAAQSAEAREI